ncbi:MAG: hypothetical protein HOO99_08310 [Hyphomicrobiaceae bacterium]|nr:hypothetical protein [Hyphomicrobiaceae bacterium]
MTDIKPINGAKGIDVHEHRRQAGQQGVPEFAGDQLVEVRSYANQEGSGDVEFAGATCTVSAAEFSATATTPAKVRVPLYRGQSSTLAVMCASPGFKNRSITLAPDDVTRQQRYSTGSGAGVLGLVAAVAVDGLSDNTKNEWRYPLARMVLEKDTGSQKTH